MDQRTIIYDALIKRINGARPTPSRWMKFNGPCCVHNGQSRPDTKKRCGLMFDADGRTTISCFNCGFKTSWAPGSKLTSKWKAYFLWLGTSSQDFDWLNFYVEEIRRKMINESADFSLAPRELLEKLDFANVDLPEGAKPLEYWLEHELVDQNFLDALVYLEGRGTEILQTGNFYWTPNEANGMNRRIIIPFFWHDEIVGYTARAIDKENKTRYISSVQPRYLFNTEVIQKDWEYLFLTEGPFDAKAVGGVALLGDKVMPDQANWIRQQGKKVVVIPDQMNKGGRLVDTAIEEGWYVAFPKWDMGIKDTADAVKAYGKLYTVWSIIDVNTKDKLTINVWRQRLK